tara:strand:- start:2861 stop:3967 length:1107 start_codon:yes stop_codon:yes gene_type:complete
MDIKQTEQKLSDFAEKLETSIIKSVNPVNADEEKQKFFSALEKHQIYNPRFQYLSRNPLIYYFNISPEYVKMIKELKALETDNSVVGKLFEKKKEKILHKIALVKNIGGLDFTTRSIGFYGKPSKKIVKFALETLELKGKETKKDITARRAASFLQKEINKKKLGFKVEIDDSLSSNAAVFNNEKRLALKNVKFSKRDLLRLKFHEIQTHMYRYVNGMAQPIKLFSSGLSQNWVATEEGLAAKNEEIFGTLSNNTLRNYAGRVIALDYGLEHSFFETFRYMKNFFDDEMSYYLTQRVKRGLVRTERKGAFTKDFLYLKGKTILDEFVEQGNDLRELYYGKIALDEAKVVKKLDFLKEPKLLPRYAKSI